MKNDYEIRGDVTAIFLNRKSGASMETIIDTDDLPKAKEFKGTWYGAFYKNGNCYRVQGNDRTCKSGSQKNVMFHRFITDAPDGLLVDHINHDTSDNRRSNLRFATNSENQQNRLGAAKNNKSSGVRGVKWHKRNRAWKASVIVNKKEHLIGYFKNKEEAAIAVAEARAKLMPYSQEAMTIKTFTFDKKNKAMAIPKNNTSGIIGVSWSKNDQRWCAYFQKNYKRHWVGSYRTREEAASALFKAREGLKAISH